MSFIKDFFGPSKEEIENLKKIAFENSKNEIEFIKKYIGTDKIVEIFADTRHNQGLYVYSGESYKYEIFIELAPCTGYTSPEIRGNNIQSLEYLYDVIKEEINDEEYITKMVSYNYQYLGCKNGYFTFMSPKGFKEDWTRSEMNKFN